MRIDASGNVLVGKTANNNTTAGGSIRAGESSFVADGSRTVLFNRLSSDGDIVEFRKDGTTVGSIGTNGGRPFFKNSTYGGLKVGTGYSVDAANNSTGAGWDNALDLGAGGTRWKDLYLSGGAYLGGTGSANKLDDYEIGSISSISGGGLSYTLNAGNYVKVGDLVHFEIDFQFPSTSNTNTAEVSVLPFTFQSNFGSGSIGYHTRSGDTTTYISGGTTNVRFASNAGSNFRNVDMSGVRIIAAYTYRAS